RPPLTARPRRRAGPRTRFVTRSTHFTRAPRARGAAAPDYKFIFGNIARPPRRAGPRPVQRGGAGRPAQAARTWRSVPGSAGPDLEEGTRLARPAPEPDKAVLAPRTGERRGGTGGRGGAAVLLVEA